MRTPVTPPNEIYVPAPAGNYSPRVYPKVGFILHWMAGYLPGTDRMFQNPATGYCTNYGIGSRDGKGNGLEVHRYTPTDLHRAFGSFNDDADSRGISIEIENAYPNPTGTPTRPVLELVAEFMAAKADALGLGPLVLGDFPDHDYYLEPIPEFGTVFNVTTHRSMALKDCPGSTPVQWLVDQANALRNPLPASDPLALARRSDTMHVRLDPAVYGDASKTVYEVWRNPATGKRELLLLTSRYDAAAAANLAVPCDATTLFKLGQDLGYQFGTADPKVLTARA